ncbi:hypothetical protein PRUPE_7G248400 [Prunus persica]|uniref:Uncharacterized protein n=1 Tax=Prunus persica TaxID=3760 RepID=A0A251NGG8_PRUPE|nr:hypothetical protein PRUPE_7G248400 [Prunus persica]ONH98410.1 hypothetical protein PRUPE_7G248400 [Prunus persica]ONH98411.1 hypothetical protein PRUPE_7G248400 [Prunus persica]ONH98412.1 hypothetical protein PRUPE_7G248400 [Prunus persica]ONH98413.1 hypothetical protein PRUPE_7G248400 [Prunus persica]
MSHLHRSYDPTCIQVLMSPTNLKCIIVAHLSFAVCNPYSQYDRSYKFGFSLRLCVWLNYYYL